MSESVQWRNERGAMN